MDNDRAVGGHRRPPVAKAEQPELVTLPASRFSGFKTKDGEEHFEDPFAHTSAGDLTGSTRSPSPLRGGITPPGYQRRTSLSNGRNYGLANSGSQKPSPSAIPRARVSSVKDRVAMFESRPSGEASPVPTRPMLRALQKPKGQSAASKVLQPHIPVTAKDSDGKGRSPKKLTKENRPLSSTLKKQHPSSSHGTNISTNGRAAKSMRNLSSDLTADDTPVPLFGETFAVNSGPGYGISSPRTRRGSEGSPLRSPNPMFSEDDADGSEGAHRVALLSKVPKGSPTKRQRLHRRAHSDHTAAQGADQGIDPEIPKPWLSSQSARSGRSTKSSGAKQGSRIPVRTRQGSHASDSADSIVSSRASSAMDRYATRAATPSKGLRQLPNGPQKITSPGRRAKTPLQTRIPGGQAYDTLSSQLTANIIAPPPKVSPTLRSSRPRQPIWMASTAASRAKAVDEWQVMEAQPAKPLKTSPRKLPELKNVDFAARRSRIISHSVAEQARQTALAEERRAEEERARQLAEQKHQLELEALKLRQAVEQSSPSVFEGITDTDDQNQERTTPEAHLGGFDRVRALTLDTKNVSPPHAENSDAHGVITDMDSPTLGGPSRSERLSATRIGGETDVFPHSATTMETEGTPIDTEPQVDFPAPERSDRTILSQIMQMRQPSMLPSPIPGSERSDSEAQSDKESVQILLRDTAVYQDTEVLEEKAEPRSHAAIDSALTPSNESWTSSLESPQKKDAPEEYQRHNDSPLRGLARLSNAVAAGQVLGSPGTRRYPTGYNETSRDSEDPYGEEREDMSHRATTDSFYTNNLSCSQSTGSEDSWDSQHASYDHSETENNRNSFTIPQPLHIRKAEQPYLGAAVNGSHTINGKDQEPRSVETDKEDNRSLRPAQTISGTQHTVISQYRANPAAREDWEQASPSPAQWSLFASESTDVSTDEDDSFKPTPPPKDEDLSDRATTPRARRTSPLPGIDSISQGADTLSSAGLPHPSSPFSSPPPIPTYSPPPPPPPPPPPMGGIQTTEVPETASMLTSSSSQRSVRSNINNNVEQQPQVDVAPSSLDAVSKSGASTGNGSFYAAAQLRRRTMLQGNTNREPLLERTTLSFDGATLVSTKQSRPSTDTVPSILLSEDPSSFESRRSTLLHERLLSVDTTGKSTATAEASPSLSQKRLNKRWHIMAEIVGTEKSYHQDLSVVVSIYKGTATDVAHLTKDDERIVFCNVEDIYHFSNEFWTDLKYAAPGAFAKFLLETKKTDRTSKATSSSEVADDTASFLQDNKMSPDDNTRTTVGKVFNKHIAKMEELYTIYVKGHEASIRRLNQLQQEEHLLFWVKACAKESADLTNAWDLSSLLVKPVQRFLKYPLLLSDLLEVTDEDHPDYANIKEALLGVRNMALRINERKKQHEIVSNVVGPRKRKETSVAAAISKAIGRRTEKLKQQVGLSEYVEDRAYDVIKTAHIENRTMLMLVRQEIADHITHIESAQKLFAGSLSDVEGFGSVGDDRDENAEFKSKWVTIRKIVKEIHSVALPAYVEQVTRGVLVPMDQAFEYLQALEKGIMAKRDNRVLDYSRYRNLKQKGAKIDKKTEELGEEYLALNKEAKHRMGLLLPTTKTFAGVVLDNLVNIEKMWWRAWGEKFRWIMDKDPQDLKEVVSDWHAEYSLADTAVLSLGICNGSFLSDTANLVAFGTRNSSFTGEGSPRQPSVSDAGKRSFSIEGSPALNSVGSPQMAETSKQNSPFLPGRLRASSTTSGSRGSMATYGSSTTATKRPVSVDTTANSRRPTTSSAEPSPRLPRLSVETPSPSLGPFPVDFTFGIRGSPADPGQRFSGTFNSAMPMGESPRATEPIYHDEATEPNVIFLAASIYEFNIDRSRREAGYPYLTYTAGEVFDVVGERGELWLARNQDDPAGLIGWIWNRHFAKIVT